jgi:hypothetical protein
VGQQPVDGAGQLGGLRAGAGEGQGGQGRRLGGRAVPGVRVAPVPVAAGPPARPGRLGLGPGAEHVEHLAGQRGAVEVGEGQRQVRQRHVREALPQPVQGVGLLEGRLPARAQRVHQRGPGLVVGALDLRHLLRQVRRGLVRDLRVGHEAQGLGRGQGEDHPGRRQAVAGRRARRAADDPRPAAVLVLRRDQLGHQPADPLGQPGRFRRLGGPDGAQVLQRRGGRQQVAGAVGRRARRRREAGPQARVEDVRIRPQRQLDQHPPQGRRDDDEHLGLS